MKITEIRVSKLPDDREQLVVRFIDESGARGAKVYTGPTGEIQKVAGSIYATGKLPVE